MYACIKTEFHYHSGISLIPEFNISRFPEFLKFWKFKICENITFCYFWNSIISVMNYIILMEFHYFNKGISFSIAFTEFLYAIVKLCHVIPFSVA